MAKRTKGPTTPTKEDIINELKEAQREVNCQVTAVLCDDENVSHHDLDVAFGKRACISDLLTEYFGMDEFDVQHIIDAVNNERT